MEAAFLVRDAKPSDFATWKLLWDGYNAFYGRRGSTALSEEITQTTWQRFFDPHEPVRAIVAERGLELVGLAHYIFHRSTIQIADTCYLQDLFTSETARGTGIGRALIEAVYERARSAKIPRVYWQTHETNNVAMRLYDNLAEKSGFVVYRKMMD